MTTTRSHGVTVAVVALVARLAVVAWAHAVGITAAADGVYYEKIAARIASGHGYTWVWPDGVVTYAAHYPVGYPAIVALGYVVFGAHPVVAMVVNALLGAGAAVAAWAVVRRTAGGDARLALGAGIALAVHPVLVPYTPAIMTEGVTAALLVLALAAALRARSLRGLALAGIVMGVATLVRPQVLVLAPVLGFLVFRTRGAALVTAIAIACRLPWTARNCARMEQCALVSVNGGWNLAIGAQTDKGGWQEIAVPEACKTVFQEAAKDSCFGREATKQILAHPGTWLARAPAKLRMTFDYFGAAPWYLHDASPQAFSYDAKVRLGALETIVSRLLLAAALIGILRLDLPESILRKRARQVLCGIGLIACVLVPGTIGYLALALAVLAIEDILERPVLAFTSAAILTTAAIHAVFFGAGRYGMVIVPFVTLIAFRPCQSVASITSLLPSMPSRRSPVPSKAREESPSSTERDAG